MRARGSIWLVVGLSALTLVSCDDKTKTSGGTPAENVQAALDPCAEGRGAFASRICQNRALAELDSEVSETLVAEAASVSVEGARLLAQDQQRWRESQRIACGMADPGADPTPEQQQCLEARFRARAQEAASAVEQVGGYTFQRVEIVDAAPVTASIASASGFMSPGEAPPAITRDIRFPRIDGPQTPQIQRFNELVAQQPQYQLSDAVEEQVEYHIAFAGPELISVRFDLYESALGAAHPNSTSKAVTVNMTTGQPLAAADVFRPGSNWQAFVTRRAVRELTDQFAEYEFAPPERDVRESATKPHLWLITENALVILFPPYSFGGPHALGGAEVAISWEELRPYLNPEAPAPIRPQA